MYTHLLSEFNPELAVAVRSQDQQEIGSILHQAMLTIAGKGAVIPNTFYAFNSTKMYVEQIEAPTALERVEQAKQFGRNAADEFGVDPIFYIVHQAMTYECDQDSGYLPNDDPHRTESCYTFVAPVLNLCTADTVEQHMQELKDWNVRVWANELHEGVSKKERHSNTRVITATNKENGDYPEDETNTAVIDNYLLVNCVIGLSAAFPALQSMKQRTPLQNAISLQLAARRAELSKTPQK